MAAVLERDSFSQTLDFLAMQSQFRQLIFIREGFSILSLEASQLSNAIRLLINFLAD